MAFKIPNPIFMNSTPESATYERSYIAWLGIFQYQKNLKLLYEIASTLVDENFLIAGKEDKKPDSETSYYLEKLKELPNVEFIGFLSREEVMPFLSKSKYLLNTSHYEGYSNTFLEAMATGTPIMTSDKVNPDYIINNNKLGIVYNNANDLKLHYSAITPDNYKEMSSNAFNHVFAYHNYKVLANDLIQILSKN